MPSGYRKRSGYDSSYRLRSGYYTPPSAGSTLLDGLLHYWTMNESSGTRQPTVGTTTLPEASGTVYGAGAGLAPGRRVANFVAANATHFEVTNPGSITGDKTFAYWIKGEFNFWDPVYGTPLKLKNVGAGTNQLNTQGPRPELYSYVNTPTETSQKITQDCAQLWHLMVIRYDYAGRKVETSRDGAAFAAGNTITTDPITSDLLYIGGTIAFDTVQGQMANVGVWDRLLSQADAQTLFNDGLGLTYAQLSSGMKTNLVSYWNLDEVSGDRADSHGGKTAVDFNSTGSVVTPARWGGGSVSCQGAFESTNMPVAGFGDNDFTLSMWVFNGGWGGTLFSRYDTTENYTDVDISFQADGSGVGTIYFAVRDWNDEMWNAGGIPFGTWAHVVCWHDATANQIGIVVNNGTPDTEATGGPNTTLPNVKLLVGSVGAAAQNYISNFATWDRKLTVEEITELYNSGAGKFYPFE